MGMWCRIYICFFFVAFSVYRVLVGSDTGRVFESSTKCRFICEEERESQVIQVLKLGSKTKS